MTKILIPSGALGLGWDADALKRGLGMDPDLIAIDGGSTDSGPSYLGRGVSKYARSSTKVEWGKLIDARAEANVPLVIGTAGTCGSGSSVEWLFEITEEVLREKGLSAKIAVLKSDQSAERVNAALTKGDLTPLPHAPEIDAEILKSCSNIVALAGAEQITKALETGADIVIAGRTTDTATIAALPILRGDHPGAAWHAAKIGECGALCATNPQSGVIMLEIDASGFVVTPLSEGAACTPHTVSAHMLYENSDPYILYEPGGHLDVTNARYRALDNVRVRVEASQWVPSVNYTVKLEGARIAGYQTIMMATLRDRHYVANANAWCNDILRLHRAKVLDRMSLSEDQFTVELRMMGVDATLGTLENDMGTMPTEVGVLAIVTAETQQRATEIAKFLNPYLLHHPLTQDEELPTFAFPFSPAEIERGPAWEFCLNHVMRLEDPMDAFTLDVRHA